MFYLTYTHSWHYNTHANNATKEDMHEKSLYHTDFCIEILNDYEMISPIIPPNAVIMGNEELQVAMMKVYAAESVI